MTQTREIKITDADLIKVKGDRKFTAPKAKKIIADAKKVIINGTEAKEKSRAPTAITVEPPSDLGEEPWIILLTTDKNEIIAILSYDPEKKEFPAPPDDEEDEDEEEEDLDRPGEATANPGRSGGRK